jgi:hypothetical protein
MTHRLYAETGHRMTDWPRILADMNRSSGWRKVFGNDAYHFYIYSDVDGYYRSLCDEHHLFSLPRNADQNDAHPQNCKTCLTIKSERAKEKP